MSYDDFDEQVYRSGGGQRSRRDIEADLRELTDLIVNAKQMPLSNSALIVRDDVLALLEQALRNLPDEIREARWALRDREDLMAAEVQKAQQLMDQVRAEAARMVDRTEIVRQSRLTAEQIVADAQSRARAMVNEAEDYIDAKLGNFEIVLERLLKTTRSGRERLAAQVAPLADVPPPALSGDEPFYTPPTLMPTEGESPSEGMFFDQDA